MLATVAIVLSGCWHIAYISQPGSLDLAPDEAHYWMWSQRLDVSYYSKGPLVAWFIRVGCELFGNNVLGVRMPAVVCGSAMIVGLYVLTFRVFGCDRLACLVVFGALTLPAVALSRSVMTIDAPFTCCWCWSLVFGHEAIVYRARWAWPALGATLAVGILAKYTMLLWLASALLFILSSQELRPHFRGSGFWIVIASAAAGCVPILWWNYEHDWVSFRHVNALSGVSDRADKPPIRWLGPLVYLGTQFAILLGFWFVVWLCSMFVHRPGQESNPSKRFLWWLSAPTFLLFLAFSLRTEVLLNWTAPAYLSGLVLAAGWLHRHLTTGSLWKRLYLGVNAAFAIAVGLFISFSAFHVETIRPLLVRLAGPPTQTNRMPLRRFDPTCRLRGWRYLGAEVSLLAEEMRTYSEEPHIAASRWYYASEVAFYSRTMKVYSFGPAVGDRQSQFDIWRPNPICDPSRFLGKTFIFIDVRLPQDEIEAAFESVEPVREVLYTENGQPIARWYLTICRGFRGFSRLPSKTY